MHPSTSSRHAIVATAVGLVLSLSLAACSRSSEGGATPATVAQASQAVFTPTPTAAGTADPAHDPTPTTTMKATGEPANCSLLFIYGDLVADNGRTVLVTSPNYSPYWDRPVPLDWPDDWTIRPGQGGQLDVVDGEGTVQVRTGTFITLSAVSDPAASGNPWFRDGEMVVCHSDWWPAPLPRPDDF